VQRAVQQPVQQRRAFGRYRRRWTSHYSLVNKGRSCGGLKVFCTRGAVLLDSKWFFRYLSESGRIRNNFQNNEPNGRGRSKGEGMKNGDRKQFITFS
jgi:hypothetical protein